LLDESGALRATGFNEAVDRIYDTLEVGKVVGASVAIHVPAALYAGASYSPSSLVLPLACTLTTANISDTVPSPFAPTLTIPPPLPGAQQVYLVRGGRLKPSNPRFSQIKNEYELSLDEGSTFTLDTTDDGGLPQQKVCAG